MDHPQLRCGSGVSDGFFFFAQARIEPRKIISSAYPHDAGEDVDPTEDEIEPFAYGGIKSHQFSCVLYSVLCSLYFELCNTVLLRIEN